MILECKRIVGKEKRGQNKMEKKKKREDRRKRRGKEERRGR